MQHTNHCRGCLLHNLQDMKEIGCLFRPFRGQSLVNGLRHIRCGLNKYPPVFLQIVVQIRL